MDGKQRRASFDVDGSLTEGKDQKEDGKDRFFSQICSPLFDFFLSFLCYETHESSFLFRAHSASSWKNSKERRIRSTRAHPLSFRDAWIRERNRIHALAFERRRNACHSKKKRERERFHRFRRDPFFLTDCVAKKSRIDFVVVALRNASLERHGRMSKRSIVEA